MAPAMAHGFWPDHAGAAVSFSFDDARLTQIDRGMDILGRHAVRATFYVSPPNVVVSPSMPGFGRMLSQARLSRRFRAGAGLP